MAQLGKLNGKVAIVTGAAGGIGEAICERFLVEGSKVMMVGRNQENLKAAYDKLNAKYKQNVAMIQRDVAVENSASEVFTAVSNQFGMNCNVLVNNAAVLPLSPIVETTASAFKHILDVNLFGVFTFTKEFLLRLKLGENKDATGASIINVSGIAAVRGLKHASVKVAIVTGAAGGIGEAICERFLVEGSKVMMVGRNQENLKAAYDKLNAKYKQNVAMIQRDVAVENSASEVFTAVSNQFGMNCNVLVNNAAVLPLSPIVETTASAFKHILDVNLFGVFTFTKEFLLRLKLGENKDATGASIINVSGIAAVRGLKHASVYTASKAGVIAFTKTTCLEVASIGVRCNVLLPGPIDTPMLGACIREFPETAKPSVPMGRFGKPFEVANACLFLASDESSYVNGATLKVAGGITA